MAIRNPPSWMWAEACEMLEQAQRLQRQFFRFGQPYDAQPRWEPPVDVVAYGSGIQFGVAMPGGASEHVKVRIDSGLLIVNAVRPMPMQESVTAVHRLEIPYG